MKIENEKEILEFISWYVRYLNDESSKLGIVRTEHKAYKKSDGTYYISDCPKSLYKNSILKYTTPLIVGQEIKDNIQVAKRVLDSVHNNSLPGKFCLNKCFENSELVFDSLSDFYAKNSISNVSVGIVHGFQSHKIPLNRLIENTINGLESIEVHNWHVWNYVNDVLIDVSIFRKGLLLSQDDYVPSQWSKMDDYSCIYPAPNLEYYGAEFKNKDEFIRVFQMIHKPAID